MAMECCEKIICQKGFILKKNDKSYHCGMIVMLQSLLKKIFSSHIIGQNLRKIMWNYVGILRSDKMLAYARERFKMSLIARLRILL